MARAQFHRVLLLAAATLIVTPGLRSALGGDGPPAADATDPSRLALATERVVVFKDGYALFQKVGTATADAEGRVFTDATPTSAVLGTVWATSEAKRVIGLRSETVTKVERREAKGTALTPLELLRANVGRDVTVDFTREGVASLAGRLVSVLEAPPKPADPAAEPPPLDAPAGREARPLEPSGGAYAALALSSGATQVFPVGEVRTVSGRDLVTEVVRAEEITTRARRLTMDLGAEAAGKPQTVRLLYFTDGMRWIPTYRVGGGLVSDAELALQGEVVNQAEDVKGAALDLVVGVPAFRFKDVGSPLTLESVMRGTLSRVAPQVMAQQIASNRFDNAFGNDRRGGFDESERAGPSALETAPELATEATQDLFLYSVGKVSLGRGARATFPLWQSTTALRHLYTMDVQVVRNYQSGEHVYRSTKRSVAEDTRPSRASSSSPVWHELELGNGGPLPWTTGAALVLKDGVPLGQDLLPYTAPGGKSLLPMTIAVDLRGKYDEQEVRREPNVLKWSGSTYSRVSKKGTLTLRSSRKEASPVRVTLSIGGSVETATEAGVVRLNDLRGDDWASGAASVNNHSDVTWELTLAPGETKTLEIAFSFYVQ